MKSDTTPLEAVSLITKVNIWSTAATTTSLSSHLAIEALGNKGWGWHGLLPYFKKVFVHLTKTICLSDDVIDISAKTIHGWKNMQSPKI